VFEEWVGQASVLGFQILPQPSERLCTQNLAGALHIDGVGCMLSVGREVKIEIPVKTGSHNSKLTYGNGTISLRATPREKRKSGHPPRVSLAAENRTHR
jgi:hypothetical protein